MEDEDELIPNPDHRGHLDLTNRAWVNLDPVIWTMSKSIISLDVSYNHIYSFPPEIGTMVVLRELRASFNKLATLPPEIGRMKRLKRLILNSNRIKNLPEDLCKLEMLEELVLSENLLEELPQRISGLFSLRVLKLQSNKLKTLPFELADVVTLEEFDVSSNDSLEVIPKAWAGDTASLLFVLRLHRGYQLQLEDMRATNLDMTRHSQYLEQEQLLMKERTVRMREEMSRLRGAISTFRLMILDREAKVAMARAGEDETGETAQKKSACTVM